MQISIKLFDDTLINVAMQSDWDALQAMEAVAATTGTTADQIRLLHNTRLLRPGKTLHALGISKGAVLVLAPTPSAKRRERLRRTAAKIALATADQQQRPEDGQYTSVLSADAPVFHPTAQASHSDEAAQVTADLLDYLTVPTVQPNMDPTHTINSSSECADSEVEEHAAADYDDLVVCDQCQDFFHPNDLVNVRGTTVCGTCARVLVDFPRNDSELSSHTDSYSDEASCGHDETSCEHEHQTTRVMNECIPDVELRFVHQFGNACHWQPLAPTGTCAACGTAQQAARHFGIDIYGLCANCSRECPDALLEHVTSETGKAWWRQHHPSHISSGVCICSGCKGLAKDIQNLSKHSRCHCGSTEDNMRQYKVTPALLACCCSACWKDTYETQWEDHYDEFDWFPGEWVELVLLKNCRELDGFIGEIVGYNAARQRWEVKLQQGVKLLHSRNLIEHRRPFTSGSPTLS